MFSISLIICETCFEVSIRAILYMTKDYCKNISDNKLDEINSHVQHIFHVDYNSPSFMISLGENQKSMNSCKRNATSFLL